MCSDEAAAVQSPWLAIVGLGAGGFEDLSPVARDLVQSAKLLVGGRRHLDLVPATAGQERVAWPSPLHGAIDTILAHRGQPVCVLATGDPFWFGVGSTLARHVDPAEMRVVPRASAFSLAAARMGWALQDTACVSVHGRALERVIPELHDGARLLILGWDGTTASALAALLCERGFGSSRMVALECMDAPDEARYAASAAQWNRPRTADLNTIAVECSADAGAATVAATAGRDDGLFEHDGQITKREIRAVTLALLAPGRNDYLWDIGAGSGAIGIEWMLSHPSNRAVAIEARADRVERIQANARACGVPGLESVEGRAPEALAGLPDPDAVFIGGGLTTPGLITACWQALPPGGRLVANSVTLEGDAVLAHAVAQHGGRLVRSNVSRTESLGAFSGWSPLRPVTTWCAVRTSDSNRGSEE